MVTLILSYSRMIVWYECDVWGVLSKRWGAYNNTLELSLNHTGVATLLNLLWCPSGPLLHHPQKVWTEFF